MTSKTLWFDLFYNGKQMKNFYVSKVQVKSVRTAKNNPPIFFKPGDQAIDDYPIIKSYIQSEKVRFNKIKMIEMNFNKTKDFDCYFDRKSSRLWFKGCYLTSAAKGQTTTKKVVKKQAPKTVKKSSLSPSDVAKSKKSMCNPSTSDAPENNFDLNKYMVDCGYAKYDYKKMDLYRFLNAYEKALS